MGLCCNPTAVDQRLRHLTSLLSDAGIEVARFFAPEHGIDGTLQDMETVVSTRADVVSLYGDDEASLRPAPSQLADLDGVIFDIQDIGTRYYTYAATLRYLLEVAATTGTRVIVLDRPCPIGAASHASAGDSLAPSL